MGIPGTGLIKKATHVVTSAGSSAVHAGTSAVSRVASGAKDVTEHVVRDTVEIGKDYVDHQLDTAKDFAAGVGQWGKDNFNTVKGIVQHPVQTAKGIGKLVTNPILNPVVGLPVALAQGKNPIEAYKEGGQQLKDIGSGLVEGWKTAYKEHGVAGVIGYAAPDVALAILTDGGSAAARGAAEVGGRAALQAGGRAALEAGGREVVEEAAESTLRATTRAAAKEVFVPGPEDVADASRDKGNDRGWLDRLADTLW